MTKVITQDDIHLLPVDDLIPYHNNPKDHQQDKIDKLKSAIKHFGFTVPIIVDGENEIVAGHARVMAARELGLERVPCVVRDDLTEAQVRAFRIADNRVAESPWDIERLAEELSVLEIEFEGLDFNLEDITGLDESEIEDLLDVDEIESDWDAVVDSAAKGFREYVIRLTDEQYDAVRDVVEDAIDRGLGAYPENPSTHGNAVFYLLTGTKPDAKT